MTTLPGAPYRAAARRSVRSSVRRLLLSFPSGLVWDEEWWGDTALVVNAPATERHQALQMISMSFVFVIVVVCSVYVECNCKLPRPYGGYILAKATCQRGCHDLCQHLTYYWWCNFPISPRVRLLGWLVGRFVIISKKGSQVTLPFGAICRANSILSFISNIFPCQYRILLKPISEMLF